MSEMKNVLRAAVEQKYYIALPDVLVIVVHSITELENKTYVESLQNTIRFLFSISLRTLAEKSHILSETHDRNRRSHQTPPLC